MLAEGSAQKVPRLAWAPAGLPGQFQYEMTVEIFSCIRAVFMLSFLHKSCIYAINIAKIKKQNTLKCPTVNV